MSNKIHIYLFSVLTLIYLGLTFGLPPDPTALAKYHLTTTSVRVLSLSIVVPLIFVWLTALYGFVRFKSYAALVAKTNEGWGFAQLVNGLMVLVFGLPITGIITALLNYIAIRHTTLIEETTLVRNYLNVAFPLVGILLIAKGAHGLVKSLRPKKETNLGQGVALVLIVLSSFYTWLILVRPAGVATKEQIYFLPNWLILLTIVIPYLFIWFKGLQTTFWLFQYRNKVGGTIYKDSLKYLAQGIGSIILLSIFIQFLTTISDRLTRLHLTPILLIVYFLVLLYAVGYGLVAKGAKKLKKIEEV